MSKKSYNEALTNHRCDCSEDDNCGCTYPENMKSYHLTEDETRTEESYKITTPERFIKKDTVCYCNPENCDCTITYEENDAE